MDLAKQYKPRVAILAAYWFNYPTYAEVEKTVSWLNAEGIEKVIIVGPVPEFRISQPKLLVRAIRGTNIPERLKTPFYDSLSTIDRTLREIALKTGRSVCIASGSDQGSSLFDSWQRILRN